MQNRPYLTATVFAKLQQGDPHGRISVKRLFDYAMKHTWLQRSRFGLSLYDETGNGFLTEKVKIYFFYTKKIVAFFFIKDLELYIKEQVTSIPELQELESRYITFYVCTAVRKFFFFLDPKRLGKVRITDILVSGFLDDLLEV